jgi:hypothetical protein
MTRGSGYSQLEKILEVTEKKNSEAHVSNASFLKSPDLVVVNFSHPAWLVESLFPTGSVGEGVGGGPGLGPGSVSESDKKEGFGAFVSECLSELFARFLRDNDDEDEDDMACLPDVDAHVWSWSALLKEDAPCVILDTYTNGVINASVAVLPAGLPAGLHEVDGHAVACLFIEFAGSNCTYSWLRQQGLQALPGKHTRGGPESVMAWSSGSPREAKANPWSVMADCFALVNFHVSIVCGRPDDNGFRKAWAPINCAVHVLGSPSGLPTPPFPLGCISCPALSELLRNMREAGASGQLWDALCLDTAFSKESGQEKFLIGLVQFSLSDSSGPSCPSGLQASVFVLPSAKPCNMALLVLLGCVPQVEEVHDRQVREWLASAGFFSLVSKTSRLAVPSLGSSSSAGRGSGPALAYNVVESTSCSCDVDHDPTFTHTPCRVTSHKPFMHIVAAVVGVQDVYDVQDPGNVLGPPIRVVVCDEPCPGPLAQALCTPPFMEGGFIVQVLFWDLRTTRATSVPAAGKVDVDDLDLDWDSCEEVRKLMSSCRSLRHVSLRKVEGRTTLLFGVSTPEYLCVGCDPWPASVVLSKVREGLVSGGVIPVSVAVSVPVLVVWGWCSSL